MSQERRVRVVVNGYGVFGKRVADGITLQDDMELDGVADVASDYRSVTADGSIEKTPGGITGALATRSGL